MKDGKHTIRRNGRVYDRLDPRDYAVVQIARSYAWDMGGSWSVEDEGGRIYWTIETQS